MEFPSIGDNCQFESCNRLDLLPLQCKCGMVFCREHLNQHFLFRQCAMAPKPRKVNLQNDEQIYRCSQEGCKRGNLHEMLCKKCNKHYCIDHRFHPSCPEIDEETMAAKIKQFEEPRLQFQEANKHLQEKITENIRKALQSSIKVKTASKIHLMRIKQKALGPKSVPAAERVYFSIKKPLNLLPKNVEIVKNVDKIKPLESIIIDPDLKDTIPVFISKRWSLGRGIDTICESCNIKNDNNKISPTKIRLFRQLDGYGICPKQMGAAISELLMNEVLLEGDKLVLEYIDSEVINELDENAQIFLSSESP